VKVGERRKGETRREEGREKLGERRKGETRREKEGRS